MIDHWEYKAAENTPDAHRADARPAPTIGDIILTPGTLSCSLALEDVSFSGTGTGTGTNDIFVVI